MTDSTLSTALALVPIAQNSTPRIQQALTYIAYGPPAAYEARVTQAPLQIAYSAGTSNVTAHVTDVCVLIAYGATPPVQGRMTAWTFVMDGHRFYVLPLAEEGDWAYDTTTKEWCQVQTQGFNGLNFTNGVMWGIRVMGADSQQNILLELDPTQPLDDDWRPVQRIVTGGIPTRSRANIGVANFTLTASVNDDASIDSPISLAFSDDNGGTWSKEFDIPLTDMASQVLIWNALGSFQAPGRIFRITDQAGPVRLDGADVVLNYSSGADSGQDQEGQVKR